MIKHTNIVYVRDIAPIGGVETYVYELIKKYCYLDIAVVCRTCAPAQKKRLEKYCRVYMFNNEPIECDVAVINYDTSIIDYLPERIWKENLPKNSKCGIYQGVHADYTHPAMGALPQDPRIKEYLCITKEQMDKWPLMTTSKNVRLCRNPLQVDDKDTLVIVSPTRLTKQKGGEIMLQLANEMEKQGTPFIWFVITTEEYLEDAIFRNSNVIWIRNRLDVSGFLSIADWVVLPSECEGDSYTMREALYRGIPLVARELGYFKEYDIKDGKNALFITESNIAEVAKRMKKRLKFTFKPIEDSYKEIFKPSKSHFKQDKLKKVRLKCVSWVGFDDLIENRHIKENEIVTVSEERASELLLYKGVFEVAKEDQTRDVKNLSK